MSLSRRGFLGGIIAAACAPALVRPGLIMPIKPSLLLPFARHLTITGAAGLLFTLVGTDVQGNEITETISMDGNSAESQKEWKSAPHISVMNFGTPKKVECQKRIPITGENFNNSTLPAERWTGTAYETLFGSTDAVNFSVTSGRERIFAGDVTVGEALIYEALS